MSVEPVPGRKLKVHPQSNSSRLWDQIQDEVDCLTLDEFEALIVPERGARLEKSEIVQLEKHVEECETCAAMLKRFTEAEQIAQEAISRAIEEA